MPSGASTRRPAKSHRRRAAIKVPCFRRQWQAQALPHPPAEADGVSGLGAAAVSDGLLSVAGLSAALSAGLASDGLAGALPLLRKSVAYQPDPLSWKPAA